MDKFCQAICASSNDVSGSGKNGYLIIGAKDNGEVSGLKVDDKLLLQIANIRTDGNILSQPLMSVETSIAQKRPIPLSVLREETVAKYQYWVTRELLMNAIMHQDYETNAPTLFYEYDDKIEIQNGGGLYGKVSPENFPNVSDYRNPFIAEAMILSYVNRFSREVYRVQKELEDNGN